MQSLNSYEAKVLFFLVSMLFLGVLKVTMERHPEEWCRKKFVGRLRPMLEPPAANGVLLMPAARKDASQLAAHMLREHCRACGGCDLAKDAPP